MMRSSLRAKHIYDDMFIEDLVKLPHYDVTLDNIDIMLISHQFLVQIKKEMYKSLIKYITNLVCVNLLVLRLKIEQIHIKQKKTITNKSKLSCFIYIN